MTLIHIVEAARQLGVHRRTLRYWSTHCGLEHVMFRGTGKFARSAPHFDMLVVYEWLETHPWFKQKETK